MASASLLQPQPPQTTTNSTAKDSLEPEQSPSADSPFHDHSPNPSNLRDGATQLTGTTHSPSDLELHSKPASSPQDDVDTPSSLSSLEVDAEGSPEFEYDTLPVMEAQQPHAAASPSSSIQSSHFGKRKLSLDDEEHIKNNPELYGLRRSRRATNAPRVIESSGDESESDIVNKPPRKRRKVPSIQTQRPSENPSSGSRSRQLSSDSEADTYGGARARALTKTKRRLQSYAGAGSSTPSYGEIRFSTRRSAKVATYNEDESEDEFAEDLDSLTPNYEQEIDDNSPAIDAVLKHRVVQDISSVQPRKEEFEYYIKWQNKSHYHATWETYSELAKLKGAKKVKNYFESIVREEHRIENDRSVQLEEKEQWYLNREEKADELADFTVVERVIDMRQVDGESEYLVKWKGLFYDDCTWESASLVSSLSQKEIDRFLNRTSYLPVSNKTESNLQTRSPYKPFREQPSYIKNGELREFQIAGVNFLAHNWCKGNSVILADEMGLGKTVQTVAFMSWLRNERQQHGPFLVVVPLSTMRAWADTFDHWAPDTNYVIYTGGEVARTIIRDKELFIDGNPKKTRFNVLLTTYEYVTRKDAWTSQLWQTKWQFLAVDEAHRLKNKDSQLYERLMSLGAPSRLLITGTPVQNNLGELSALMSFLMPGKINLDENIDLSSDAASHKIQELTQEISPYIIRRTKQKVETDLPPKTEKIIRVELSDVQLDLYKNILTRNYTALNQGGNGYKQSLLNIMMELKKASNHPFMFPSAEERLTVDIQRREEKLKAIITSSGKMMLLDQLLTKLKKDNHRVLVFSQMVTMLNIIGEYLNLRGYQFQRIDGTVAGGARQLSMDHFNAPESKDFCFLLSTRAGGLGINLMTADTVILFDSDWNPQADLQAMSRAHRIGQRHPVTVYRFVSKDTVEEEILERARNKLMLEFITIQRGVTDKDTSDLNKRIKEAKRGLEGSPNDPDDINRILKRRGQKMFEQSGNQKRLEELDIDAVLESAEEHKTEQPEGLAADGGEDFLKSFEYTDVKVELEWDQIIPEDRIAEIKAEEQRKAEAEYLESIIEENAPRKRKAPPSELAEDREHRAAKKRARDRAAAESSAAEDDESDSALNLDPKRPMVQKEIRHLIRAYEKFGHVDDRPEDVLKEAKLVGRDFELVQETLNEVIQQSKTLLQDVEEDRFDSIHGKEAKISAQKSGQTVIFEFKGVKRLNAKTIVERQDDMRLLRNVTNGVPDFKNFRVPSAMKPAGYSAEWGAREDGMLCIGVARHGHGSWAAIKDDPELGMSDKIFLEENQVARKEERNKAGSKEEKAARTPGAVHLVRRTAYLLDVLKATTSNSTDPAAQKAQKALENHHRNTKKSSIAARRLDKSARPSSSPGPANLPKSNRDFGKPRAQHPDSNDRRPLPNLKPSDRPRSDRPISENRDAERQRHPRDRTDEYERVDYKGRRLSDLKHPDRPRSDRPISENREADRQKHPRDMSDDREHADYKRRRVSGDQKGYDRLDNHESRDYKRRHLSGGQNEYDRSSYHDSGNSKRRRLDGDHREHDRSDHYESGTSRRHRLSDEHRNHDRYRPSHHGTDSDVHKAIKYGQHAMNGDHHHPADERHKNATHQNGPKYTNGQQRKEGAEESSRSSDPPRKDPRMEAFFKPVTGEIESLKEGKQDSGNDAVKRTKIIKDGLTAIGQHIAQNSIDEDKSFEDDSWEYFAKHFWLNKKTTGEALKKKFDGIVEKAHTATQPTAS